jgi:hypothetical protein
MVSMNDFFANLYIGFLVAIVIFYFIIVMWSLYFNLRYTNSKNPLPTAAMEDEKNTFFVDMGIQGMFATTSGK